MNSSSHIALMLLLLLGGCEIANRDFYELSAQGGTMTREGAVSRLAIPISDDIILGVSSFCYVPRPFDTDSEPCGVGIHVGIYAYGSGADSFRFSNLDFTVKVVDPPSAQLELRARLPDFGEPPPNYETRTWPVKALIDFNYEDIPQRFTLNLPAFLVTGDSYQPPPVTFAFERNVGVVPWGW